MPSDVAPFWCGVSGQYTYQVMYSRARREWRDCALFQTANSAVPYVCLDRHKSTRRELEGSLCVHLLALPRPLEDSGHPWPEKERDGRLEKPTLCAPLVAFAKRTGSLSARQGGRPRPAARAGSARPMGPFFHLPATGVAGGGSWTLSAASEGPSCLSRV